MATLKAQHLAKSYKSRQVVRDVSLSIDSGQIVGLLGPNGAGKTTCFYMIVGLVQADQGRVLIDDLDVSHQPMHGRARAGIGYLPQEASIFRKLSVADNIMAILETRKELDKAGRRKELESLLQEFHISHIRDSLGMSLSGGERRRVEIARALATAHAAKSFKWRPPADSRPSTNLLKMPPRQTPRFQAYNLLKFGAHAPCSGWRHARRRIRC